MFLLRLFCFRRPKTLNTTIIIFFFIEPNLVLILNFYKLEWSSLRFIKFSTSPEKSKVCSYGSLYFRWRYGIKTKETSARWKNYVHKYLNDRIYTVPKLPNKIKKTLSMKCFLAKGYLSRKTRGTFLKDCLLFSKLFDFIKLLI